MQSRLQVVCGSSTRSVVQQTQVSSPDGDCIAQCSALHMLDRVAQPVSLHWDRCTISTSHRHVKFSLPSRSHIFTTVPSQLLSMASTPQSRLSSKLVPVTPCSTPAGRSWSLSMPPLSCTAPCGKDWTSQIMCMLCQAPLHVAAAVHLLDKSSWRATVPRVRMCAGCHHAQGCVAP